MKKNSFKRNLRYFHIWLVALLLECFNKNRQDRNGCKFFPSDSECFYGLGKRSLKKFIEKSEWLSVLNMKLKALEPQSCKVLECGARINEDLDEINQFLFSLLHRMQLSWPPISDRRQSNGDWNQFQFTINFDKSLGCLHLYHLSFDPQIESKKFNLCARLIELCSSLFKRLCTLCLMPFAFA